MGISCFAAWLVILRAVQSWGLDSARPREAYHTFTAHRLNPTPPCDTDSEVYGNPKVQCRIHKGSPITHMMIKIIIIIIIIIMIIIIIITPWLVEPGGSMPHSQGCPIIPILSRMYPVPRIDTYFFKIHFNILLPSTPRSP